MNEGDFYGRFLRSWVENERIDAPLLAIIAVLAVHADIHTGISFPSQRRIAKLCGRNQPWVCKGLKKLESLGFIEIDRSYYEKNKTHSYRIKLPDYTISETVSGDSYKNQGDSSGNKGDSSGNTNNNQEQETRTNEGKTKIFLIPSDYWPDDVTYQKVLDNCPKLTKEMIEHETRRFIDYFTEKKLKRRGWDRSWKGWIERSYKRILWFPQKKKPSELSDERRSSIAAVVEAMQHGDKFI